MKTKIHYYLLFIILNIFISLFFAKNIYAIQVDKSIQDLTAFIQKIIFTSDGTPTGTAKIIINGQSGNIGIGTTSPLESLHIKNGNIYGENNAYIMQKIGIGTLNPNKELHIKNTVSNAEINIQSIDGSNNHWALYNEKSNNSLNFWQGDNRLTIQNGGNIGIGTTSPSYKLHVIGDIYANGGRLRTSGSAGWYSESFGGGWFMQDNTRIRSYGTKSVRLGGGYYGADGGLTIGYGGTVSPAGGGIFAGNVGIGTNSPSQKLQVNGNIYANGTIYLRGNNIDANSNARPDYSDTSNYSNSAGNSDTVDGRHRDDIRAWGNITGKPFNRAGQSGQPSRVWGSNDGANYYVWNPSNFNVNYANSSNYANSAGSANWANGSNRANSAGNANYANSAGSANYANGAGNADTVDGKHAHELGGEFVVTGVDYCVQECCGNAYSLAYQACEGYGGHVTKEIMCHTSGGRNQRDINFAAVTCSK